MPTPKCSLNGLELARGYFLDVGLPMLKCEFPELLPSLAVGRVGEGSECFGFDDNISRDHDFGPGFCIWLPQSLWSQYGHPLTLAYWNLPASYGGIRRPESGPFVVRVGPTSISAFYMHFLGRKLPPYSIAEWFSFPQEPLAACTNGIVFEDSLGEFTHIRTYLRKYYPEPVRMKKLAAHCALAAQAGQYNYCRCMKRGDRGGTIWALNRFMRNFVAALYLLNRRYMPYEKWAYRGLSDLPLLGGEVSTLLSQLFPGAPETESLIEQLCTILISFLRASGITTTPSSFLLSHGQEIQSLISHPELRALPLMSWISGWQY